MSQAKKRVLIPADMPPSYDIACLCGLNTHSVDLIPLGDGEGDPKIALTLCHCDACRFSSGQLCTSYCPISEPELDEQQVRRSEDGSTTRYFCRVCGCHLFRCHTGDTGEANWEVATGTIKKTRGQTDAYSARFTSHACVSDTRDGGAAVWLREMDDDEPDQQSVAHGARHRPSPELSGPDDPSADHLPAACACGTVRFSVTRPSEASYDLHSPYSDMIYPFVDTSADIISNPDGEKWWMRGGKYMTGACTCRSCRLFSGFEVQFWAFIPRANVFVQTDDDDGRLERLDFSRLSTKRILQSYNSSPGVTREFCGSCGATVFWHCEERPDLIDVSVGLFRSPEGARAESWLQWWTDRVSFDEDTETDRHGSVASTARELVDSLARGLKTWKQENGGTL